MAYVFLRLVGSDPLWQEDVTLVVLPVTVFLGIL
jgi:TRAP-type C4-dicarboxylate transport system permease small subunit